MSTINKTVFLSVLTLATLTFLWLVRDFFAPIFWAVILSIVFFPLFKKISVFYKNRTSLASITTISVALLLIILPLYFISSTLAQEGYTLYKNIDTGNITTYTTSAEKILSTYNIPIDSISEKIQSITKTTGKWFAGNALDAGRGLVDTLIKSILMLYLLFFLLRDGEKLGQYLIRIIPLGDTKEKKLFKTFTKTTRAIFKGTLIISLAQGCVGGILFWIVGIPNPVLWAAVMTILSFIPAVGPMIVWLPAGLILLALGDMWQGVILLSGGFIIISMLDNILRPILVGKDIKMHDTIIMLSIFGGLATFGISGLLIGPIIAALTITLWEMFTEEFAD